MGTAWRLASMAGTVVVIAAVLAGPTRATAQTDRGPQAIGGDALPTASAALAETPYQHGARKVLVLLVRFAGSPEDPWSEDEVRENVFTGAKSANAFFQEESYGHISLTGKLRSDGDVFGWFTIPETAGSVCEPAGWVDQAKQIAKEQGVSLDGYDDIVYDISDTAKCGWAGFATPYGIFVRGTDTATFAHELGHGLGLWHGEGLVCKKPDGTPTSLEGSCAIKGYGDPFEVMGSGGLKWTNNWNLMTLGVLSSENLQRVTESGTYTVRASLSPTSETTNLQIPHTRSGDQVLDWFDLEIKQQGGVFENTSDASKTGVAVRLVTDHRIFQFGFYQEPIQVNSSLKSTYGTLLIDANPATKTFADAPVAVGQTLRLDTAKMKVLSAESGQATVQVTFPDVTPPGGPPGFTVQQVMKSVVLGWKPSIDDTGVTRYLVFRDGKQIGAGSDRSFTDPEPSVGAHTYRVYAEDAAGNQSDTPATKTIAVLDVTAPTDPDQPAAAQFGTGVSLKWAASADDVGVARYLVFRDNAQIAAPQGPEYRDPDPVPGIHTYSVLAEDAQHNRSSSSPTNTIEVMDVAAPSAPRDLSGSRTPAGVELEWGASVDDSGSVRYRITRDGEEIGNGSAAGLIDRSAPTGHHLYAVYAEDPVGNRSASSTIDIDAGGLQSPGLRVHRRPNGVIDLKVDARAVSGVAGVELLLDGRRLKAAPTSTLAVTWSPAAGRSCLKTHRLAARAYDSTGAFSEVIRKVRLGRASRLPPRCAAGHGLS